MEARYPRDLVRLDARYTGQLKASTRLRRLMACDAAYSYDIATLVPWVTPHAAINFLWKHVVPSYERAGHRIQAVLTDGGPEWQTRFAVCRELGVVTGGRGRARCG